MRRGIGTLFVAFLAARIFLGPAVTPSPEPKPPPGATPVKKPGVTATAKTAAGQAPVKPNALESVCRTSLEKCPGKGLLDAVQDSLATSQPRADLKSLWGIDDEVRTKHAHFLIATVPDPVHSHLSLLFDRQVAAIQQAVQQAGYLFSRAYLPWDYVQHPEDTDYRVRLGLQDYQGEREKYPGVLLFHFAEASGEKTGPLPLFVFLVGETPTGGVNKDQFSNAIEAMREICSKGCDDLPRKGAKNLSILGPMFSGSFYSLHAVLEETQARLGFLSQINIRSGTASDDSTIKWFVGSTGDFPSAESVAAHSRQSAVTFETFQAGSAAALQDVLGFACTQNYQADKIAILSEDETAYGNFPTQPANNKKEDLDKRICLETENRGADRVLRLHFPRDFSALRNAYEQDVQTAASSGNTQAPRSTLRLNLRDQGNDDDSVPSFSPGQTPLSEEAILMGIVTRLRESKINLVIIEATNPLDTLFMVRYLRSAYPDARVVTLNSDLLLARQVDEPRLRGVTAVVSYPLIPGLDDGNANQCALVPQVFPNVDSEGEFLAAISLLRAQGIAYGCSPNLPELEPPDGAFAVNRLWLTALGRDQFWPVTVFNQDQTNPPPIHPEQPAPWIILSASAVAFAVLFSFFSIQGSVISSSIFLANFAPVNDPWRSRTLLLSGFLMFSVFFCLLWPRFWVSGSGKWMLILALLAVAGLVFLDLWRRNQWEPDTNLFVVGVIGFLGCFAILANAFGNRYAWTAAFLRDRYEHVSSGVSPVVPFMLLFAGFLWTCWHSLSGRPPWDRHGCGPPLPTHDQVVAGTDQNTKQRLDRLTADGNRVLVDLMRTGSVHGRLALFTGVVLAIPLLTLTVLASPHTVQSFESFSYNVTYTVLLIAAIALVVWDSGRLAFIWLELRMLLMVLDRVPLRRGFVRMAGFKSRRLWQLGGNTFEDFFAVMSMEIQTLSAMGNLPALDPLCGSAVKTGHNAVDGLADWMREQRRNGEAQGVKFTHGLVDNLDGLQTELTGSCASILQYLRLEWDREPRPVWDAERMARAAEYKPSDDVEIEVRLAEDFASLFYFNFICSVFTRMRALVLSIVGMYVFVLLSFSSYPFEPSSTFHSAMVFLLILITVSIAVVFAQAHRDATISRITDTDVGKLGFDFWFRLIATLGVPILSLLAAKFPEIGGFLFSWLEPASQAFK